MKRVFLVALALGLGFLGYRYASRSAATGVYEEFAKAWAAGNQEAALHLADGEKAWREIKRNSRYDFVPPAMVELIHDIGQNIESFEKLDDGAVAIEAKQTVAFDPPGVTSAIGGAMRMSFHHSVRMRKTPDGWRVIGFQPKLLEVGEVRRH